MLAITNTTLNLFKNLSQNKKDLVVFSFLAMIAIVFSAITAPLFDTTTLKMSVILVGILAGFGLVGWQANKDLR